MASTGDKFPTSGTNVDRSGATAWTNPGNITADDASVASVSAASDYLVATGFDFSAIPDAANIVGVTVKVEWQELTGGTDDAFAQLQDDTSTLVGSSKTVADPGASFAVSTLGGTSDVWGATLTPAIVKSANFGVRFWDADANSNNEVDYITVAIEYTVGGGLFFGML